MSKKVKIYSIVAIILFIIYWSVAATIGNVSSDREYYLPTLILIILFIIVDSIMIRFRVRKIKQLILQNEHELLIQKAKNLTYVNLINYQIIYLSIAVNSLQNDDINHFYSYIRMVNHRKLRAIRYFWETIKYILDEDLLNAENTYKLFFESPRSLYKGMLHFEWYENLLSGYIAFYRGQEQIAKEKLSSSCNETKNVIIKKLCDKILSKDY